MESTTMADYIKREDAINVYNQRIVRYGLADFESVLNQIPAADMRENVRGEWRNVVVRNKGDDVLNAIEAVASMQCPKCERWHNEVYLYSSPKEMSNFCPNCGANMRGEKDD